MFSFLYFNPRSLAGATAAASRLIYTWIDFNPRSLAGATLAFFVKTWGNYEAFAMACVSFMLAQLGNKYVETKVMKVKNDE